MEVIDKPFGVAKVINLDNFGDDRGFFRETYNQKAHEMIGIQDKFLQDNQSRSKKNVVRGLHFTINRPQSQLVTVLRGCVYDVIVDLRGESSTFGQHYSTELSEDGPHQIYVPHGFAHGFMVLSEYADTHYKVTKLYSAEDEAGILWDDPALGISWPQKEVEVSQTDQNHPTLEQYVG